MASKRITVLNVPVDIVNPEDLEEVVLDLVSRSGTKQIVLLSIWDLLHAKVSSDFYTCIKEADLILPISKSILKGAKFLNKEVPVRYNPFKLAISVLGTLDSHYRSLYILGGHKKALAETERNLHQTFPGIQIVGRCMGYFSKSFEKKIVEAIFKASPALVLMSKGVPEKQRWAYRRRNSFSNSIFFWYKDAISVFSKRKKRVSEKTFDKGLEIFNEIMYNPFKIFLIFPYMWYLWLLLWNKLRKKG